MKKSERRRAADGKNGAVLKTEVLCQNVEKNDGETNEIATRRFRSFFEFGLAATTVAAIFCAPEGAIREGDFLPVAFCFLAFVVATFFFALRTKRNFVENVELQSVEKKRVAAFEKIADFSLFAFLIWTLFSFGKLVVYGSGDVRLSTNAIWTFETPTLLYFFVRYFKTLFNNRLTTNICVLLVACAAVESVVSAYSYVVVNPRIRAEYRADPDAMLKRNGMTLEEGSRERLLFEKRLLDSSEPTGTYGLANTLAGLLAPTLVLAFVLTGAFWKKNNKTKIDVDRRNFISYVVWFVTLLTVMFALVATKSRAGVLAFFFGVAIWGVVSIVSALRSGRGVARRLALSVCCAATLGVVGLGAAFATGVLDREVFAEAGKSLGYRLDYWRASAAMIRDFPFFGVGPGEFQNVYPQYILPTASEFIADPHHFAFELAALFGVPALVAFLVFLFGIFAASISRKDVAKSVEKKDVKQDSNKAFVAGSFFGILLAFCCSAFQTAPLDASFVGFAFVVFAFIFSFVVPLLIGVDSKTKNVALVAAFAALLLNLCAAGGIGYPSITVPAFLIAASILSRSNTTKCVDVFSPKHCGAATAFFVAASIFVVFYTSAFRPRSNDFIFSVRVATPEDVAVYRDAFALGKPEKIDSRSAAVVSKFYCVAAQDYFVDPTPENEKRWKALRIKTLNVSPNSASFRENCGDFDFALFNRDRSRNEFLESAVDFYRGSVEKSPTETEKRFKYVRALRANGDFDEATRQAEKALELDAGTSHLDRKLPRKFRAELTKFLADSSK